jgi:carboxypeptidase T
MTLLLSGCLQESIKTSPITTSEAQPLDRSSVLPNWRDGDYHDYYQTTTMLLQLEDTYPNFTNVFSIGRSVLGKDIWCIAITNELNTTEKYSCLIDGCIHGHEWEGGEACLYLAEYLLINAKINTTINQILNTSIIYIVPLVNPDGRQNDRIWLGNHNGVDLNRNFDIFFGRLRGHNLRLGKPFKRITIAFIKFPPNQPPKWWRNCGRYPFSEPESQALRDIMQSLDKQKFSFYVDCHTATHEVVTPWVVFKPPFEMKSQEKQVFEDVLNWVESNTEYGAYLGGPVNCGGVAMDWCFQEFRIPSFVFEILSLDYECFRTGEVKHDHLVHWMQTTLPFFMYLLVNIENLHYWETPDINPVLPKGVPPPPLS